MFKILRHVKARPLRRAMLATMILNLDFIGAGFHNRCCVDGRRLTVGLSSDRLYDSPDNRMRGRLSNAEGVSHQFISLVKIKRWNCVMRNLRSVGRTSFAARYEENYFVENR